MKSRRAITTGLLLAALGCAHRPEVGGPGVLEGTVGGRELLVRSAILGASSIGEIHLSIADIPYTCADVETHRQPPPYTGILVLLADIAGPDQVRPKPPFHAGSFSVVHFLDFRSAWFQARGAPPRPGQGKRPPDGSYAAILSHAGGTVPAQGGEGVNWPIGTSGRVTLNHFPARAGERVTGSLDVTLASGETLRGTFSAEDCRQALSAR